MFASSHFEIYWLLQRAGAASPDGTIYLLVDPYFIHRVFYTSHRID